MSEYTIQSYLSRIGICTAMSDKEISDMTYIDTNLFNNHKFYRFNAIPYLITQYPNEFKVIDAEKYNGYNKRTMNSVYIIPGIRIFLAEFNLDEAKHEQLSKPKHDTFLGQKVKRASGEWNLKTLHSMGSFSEKKKCLLIKFRRFTGRTLPKSVTKDDILKLNAKLNEKEEAPPIPSRTVSGETKIVKSKVYKSKKWESSTNKQPDPSLSENWKSSSSTSSTSTYHSSVDDRRIEIK